MEVLPGLRLSDHNGLAPEEARPIAFEFERRLIDFTYDGDKDVATAARWFGIELGPDS